MIIDSPIISGSVAASGSLNQFGNITITGSLTVTGNITGNITGSATNAVSASYSATATSASYAANATSASYANSATSASYATSSTSASYASNATSASYAAAATSASYALSSTSASYSADATSASFAQSAISASNALTASYLSNYIPPFPFTGSAGISGSLVVNGDITSTGTLTAQTLIVQTITSSEDFVTGSTHFGSLVANTHQFTGSVSISGSLAVNDSNVVLTNQTGAMSVATASYVANAVSASYAATATSASYASATTSASYSNTSTSASYSSEATSASLAQSAISASYALTASYASNVPATSSFAVSASQAENATSASYAANADLLDGKNSTVFATTGSNTFTGNQTISSSNSELLLTGGGSYGTINFHGFNASIYDYVGQNHLRLQANSQISNKTNNFVVLDSSDNVKVNITGSLIQLSGSVSALNGFTGSLEGTASYALTASYASNVPATSSFAVSASQAQNAVSAAYSAYALTSSYSLAGSGFPFSGSAVITGSLLVTNLSSSGVSYLVADSSGFVTAQTASAVIKTTQAYTATAGQTTFSVTNGYSTGYVDVFINGSKLNDAEFIDTSGTNIILATGSFVNDVVEVVKYLPASGVSNNVLRQQTIFTASAAQTVFSASYTPGLIDIFYNGSKLNSGDFTANNGTFFTLATASAANDIVDVFVYSYQVGAFSGIGGAGTATQVAYFDTSNSITGSPNFTISGSTMTVTGSLLVSGSGTFTNIGPAVFSGSITSTQGFTGSFSGTATNATSASYAASATSASYAIVAATASYADALTVAGTLTAQTLVVQTITSSVDFVTGSTRFGSLSSNTHTFTGSMSVSGSITNSGLIFNTNDAVFSTAGSITKHATVGLVLRGVTASVFDFALYSAGGTALMTNSTGTNNLSFNSAAINLIGTNLLIGTATDNNKGGKIQIIQSNTNTNAIDIKNSSDPTSAHWGTFANNTYFSQNYYYNSGQYADTSSYGQSAIVLSTSQTTGTSTIDFNLSDPGSTSPGNKVRITSAGVVELPFGQLKFPATQNASADANTLDDYEEGTFTPTLGGNSTYLTQFGNYTKIGNKVFFKIFLTVNIIGTGDAQNISGLPFTCDNTVTGYSIYVGAFQDLSAAKVFMAGRVGASGTTIAIRSMAAAAVGVAAANVFQNGTTIEIGGFYGV